MKILTLLSLLLLWGCFPGQGGYESLFSDDEGATEPEDPYPTDTLAIISFFSRFQALTPILVPSDLDSICARADVETQQVNGLRLTTSFLETGVDQTFMAINSTIGIHNKAIIFVPESATLKEFYNMNDLENPIPPPENILPGTVVLVGVLATEDNNPSNRFADTYLLKLDSGAYVWYGNQKPALNVQEAMEYGIYQYLDDFQQATPTANPTDMDDFYAIIGDPNQTINTDPLPYNFLEYGENQADMYLIDENLKNTVVAFNFTTIEIKKFFDQYRLEIPKPSPEDILPGTIVLIGINATEDGLSSARFLDMYLMFIDGDKYVWMGNQIFTPLSVLLRRQGR